MGKENAALLCAMLATRGELLGSLQALRAETAWNRPEPSEWSVVEVLHHVADIDNLTVRRLQEVRAGKEQLSRNAPEEWEGARRAAEKDGLSGVLLRLGDARQLLLKTVSELGEAEMGRSGRHPRYGQMTALQLLEAIVRHDLDHAQQVTKTRAVVEA